LKGALTDLSPALTQLLGVEGAQVLARIDDPDESGRAHAALDSVAQALEVVRRLDLSPHELADSGAWDLSAWNALAPEVRTLLVAVRSTVDRLRTLYPPPTSTESGDLGSADIDMAFDDLDDDEGFGPERGPQVDAALADETGPVPVIAALTGMLDADLRKFGQRMRSPQLVAERWSLLGELHELKGTCVQCLDAVAAAILRPWTDQAVESFLPDYASALTRTIRLRSRIVDLHAEAKELQFILSHDADQAELVFRRIEDLLRGFAADPAYEDLRPLDKQQILQFRIWLMQAAPEWSGGAHRLEDFVRFLEVMQDINRRETLRQHDREKLELVIMLLESDEPIESVKLELESLYGRWEPLDRLLRGWRERTTPTVDAVLDEARKARTALS
jgi:hypothetical protein